jgi:hypothetical protein
MTLTFISAEAGRGGLGRLEYISVRTVAAAQRAANTQKMPLTTVLVSKSRRKTRIYS